GAKMFRWDAQERFARRSGKAWVSVALASWVIVGAMAEYGGYTPASTRTTAERTTTTVPPTTPTAPPPVPLPPGATTAERPPIPPVLTLSEAEKKAAGRGSVPSGSPAPTPKEKPTEAAPSEKSSGEKPAPKSVTPPHPTAPSWQAVTL